MNFGGYSLTKQLVDILVFVCSFGHYTLNFKSECDWSHLTRSTSPTGAGSRQKPPHPPAKGLPPPPVLPSHPELLVKVCLLPAFLSHGFSGFNISSSIMFHQKNTKISCSPSLQLSKCIDCFLTRWSSEMFFRVFPI